MLPGVKVAIVRGTFAIGDLPGMKAVVEFERFATCDALIGVE